MDLSHAQCLELTQSSVLAVQEKIQVKHAGLLGAAVEVLVHPVKNKNTMETAPIIMVKDKMTRLA